ncbi:MAG: phosphoenolpyruvate--protein phosphotransferase [Betaproteobacteria bacterium]|nr:MAG: phosphoenolpyruvate--protein phosphotransferase [Betaproteobacteria bacterium]
MSFTIHGTGICGGIAIGQALLHSHTRLEAGHYILPRSQIVEELARFDGAVAKTRAEFETLRANIPANAPSEFVAFIDLHMMILNDSTLSKVPREIIEREQCNAEWALKLQADELLSQFDAIEDGYLRERRADVLQVVERIMLALGGQPGYVPDITDTGQSKILVAHDLSPADVLQFKQHQFASFLTELGGTTSHTAVVARSLNLPSVASLHHARSLIYEHDTLIVDGTQGVVIVDPDPQVLADYRLRQHQIELERQKLRRLRTMRAVTLDGVGVELHANIELPEDVAEVDEAGASGIGLFRTEFLFMNRDNLPGEDEQFEAYRNVVESMRGLPVTIRTYDLGADKNIDGAERTALQNPALGLRAIRLCLTEPRRFQIQLRAILRASHYGKARLLIPMLSGAAEVDQTLQQIEIAKASLAEKGIAFDHDIEVGGMIEVPAAALALRMFRRKLDFLSIGTNDLIQYTLAIDRTDDAVAHLYDPLHPAILHLIALVISSANRANLPVALCGEMAGDTKLTRLLLGLGLRQLSMHPGQLLAVKQEVLRTNLSSVRVLARRMLRIGDPERMQSMLERLNAD